MDDFFGGVSQTRHDTSKGGCDLPILYRDGSVVGCFFLVPREPANRLLEHTSIEVWPLLGRALVLLFAWEYRDSTVGTYGEVGLGIQARRRGSRPSLLRLGMDMRAQEDQGVWVQNLPVTTPEAFVAGVELWGFPKYVTPIETDFATRARIKLGDELELDVGPMRGPTTKGLPTVTYTSKAGQLIRTVITVGHKLRWDIGTDTRLSLRGAGPTAESARALGLDRARPACVFRSDAFRAQLPAGTAVGPITR